MKPERTGPENLFEEFSPVTTREWEKKILEDLKGAESKKKLVWRTLDGFDMRPYYRREDLRGLEYLESEPGIFPFLRSDKTGDNSWLIRQDVRVTRPEEARKEALDAIRNGVTSVGFDIRGWDKKAENVLPVLLEDFPAGEIAINLITDDSYREILSTLAEFVLKKNHDPDKIRGSITFDPLGTLASRGNFRSDLTGEINELSDCIHFTREHLPSFRTLNIGGDLFHDAGGSITQELAYTLSLANDYLALLTENGMDIKNILPAMHFQFSAATSYFMVIAKHRAVRFLWSKIAEAYDPEAARQIPMFLHTRSSFWVQTVYDPYVNLLRTTTSSMAAIIGGTDSLQVNPFDSAYRKPGLFSKRVARNTQLILREESYLDKVIDPSAGSYYIENLTDTLITRAWEIFLKIEEQGGFHQALLKGEIQNSISGMVECRRDRFARRRDLLLGTNHYPNFEEEMKDELDPSREAGRALPEDRRIIEPLQRSRSGVQFVELRMRTELHPGKKPVAFMLTLGSLAMRRARAMFGCNFFACAGFKVIDNIGFPSPSVGIRDSLKAKSDIVVLCSSDEEYPEYAPEVGRQLRDKCIMVIAGYPEKHLDQLREAGFEHFIHTGSNVLEELTKFQKLLGISPSRTSS